MVGEEADYESRMPRQQIPGGATNRSMERVNRLTQQAQELSGRYGVGVAPVGGTTAPPPWREELPASGRPGGGGSAPKKVVTMDQLKAYSKKKVISLDAAQQEFAAAGYQVSK